MATRTTPNPAAEKAAAPAEQTPSEAPEETTDPAAIADHENVGTALAAFQAHLPKIAKGNRGTIPGKDGKQGYSYDYADLTDVSEVALPLLGAHGLAWHVGLDTDDRGDIVLAWELIHGASGTGRHGRLPIGRAGANWQSLGSSITYARRYALCAATGIAPGGDDDDAAASVAGSSAPREERRQAPPQSPVAQAPERLEAGLYDLAALTDVEAVRETFRKARAAGHLALLIGVQQEDGTIAEVPFGQHLTDLGTSLAPAPSESPADDNPDAAADEAEARAIAEHEAEEAAREAADDQAHLAESRVLDNEAGN